MVAVQIQVTPVKALNQFLCHTVTDTNHLCLSYKWSRLILNTLHDTCTINVVISPILKNKHTCVTHFCCFTIITDPSCSKCTFWLLFCTLLSIMEIKTFKSILKVASDTCMPIKIETSFNYCISSHNRDLEWYCCIF